MSGPLGRHRWGVLGFAFASVGLWLVWPVLRPRIIPAAGRPWLVVLDGYHRLDDALRLQRQMPFRGWSILLITCPATGQPTQAQRLQADPPLRVLSEAPPLGGDTAGQAAALAGWLQARPAAVRPSRLVLLSDQHHFPRAAWAMQIAAGSLGISVHPWPVDVRAPSQVVLDRWAWPQLWPSVRDVLRLQLWRLSGSTGAFLNAPKRAATARACFGAHAESTSEVGG